MYEWAANKQKLERAKAMCPNGSEQEIKDAYIKLAGLVLGESTSSEEAVVVSPSTDEFVEGKPKKKAKKK